jgi:hypothetical protein
VLDPGVLAWTEYPSGPVSVNFSGRTWGIKVTGNVPGDQFNPGPNFWSNDPSVVNVAPDGLHLKITQISGMWQCGEVYLLRSLGYGTYTVQVGSPLDHLDRNTVAAPLFVYAAPGQELDNEYSGTGGLISSPYNAQFVAQPYTIPGNIMLYQQPSTSQFTSQLEWAADHVTFRAWNGWSDTPAPTDIIYQWTYTGASIPPVGQGRVHINLWLLNGSAPISGVGDEMVIHSFNFQTPPLGFVSIIPCRVVDTRDNTKPTGFGPPFISGGSPRSFDIPTGPCSIPATAQAYSLNVTVVPRGDLGYLSVWPSGQPQPLVSTLNSLDGSVLANAAIVPAGASGSINAFATNDTDLVIDISGYFVPPAAGTLQFYPLTPCRVLDTRNRSGTFGGPSITGGTSRSFPIPSRNCNVPASAAAYSLNVTVVPQGLLGYLTVWPTGQTLPVVSTLNSLDGTVLANAAIVSAGTSGAVSIFAANTTDVIVDINGYFAPPGTGGLNFYTVTPCRIVDTRNATGTFGGPIMNGGTTRTFPLSEGSCELPSTAAAYSLNMTVVPSGFLGYLTTWPTGGSQPVVSTLNAYKGQVVANAALVPAGTGGAVNVYVTNDTQVIIDTNGYFGQ